LFDWEKQQEQQLTTLLGRKSLNEEKEDLWAWKDSDSTKHTIQSAYRVLKDQVDCARYV